MFWSRESLNVISNESGCIHKGAGYPQVVRRISESDPLACQKNALLFRDLYLYTALVSRYPVTIVSLLHHYDMIS